MSHQVNFYLTPSDRDLIESILRDVSPIIVIHSQSMSPMPRELKGLGVIEDGLPWLYFYLVQPDKIEDVVMMHVPEQGYWVVDVLRSPVVEFSQCFFNGEILRRGRVYYTDKFYGLNNNLIFKSESFKYWAKLILSIVKKSLKKHGSDYIGKDAEEWLRIRGGRLE